MRACVLACLRACVLACLRACLRVCVRAYVLACLRACVFRVLRVRACRATYFFQSELPYLVNRTFGDSGYAGYRVGPDVKDHDGVGIGVYCNFIADVVEVESAIVAPAALVRACVVAWLRGCVVAWLRGCVRARVLACDAGCFFFCDDAFFGFLGLCD